MTTTYPGALDALPRPLPSSPRNVAPFAASAVIDNVSDAIEAIEAKLGTGASVAAANQVLRGTGAGATAFGALQTTDIVANGITQIGYVSTGTTDSTSSATAVDILNMSITMTTEGGGVLVMYSMTALNSNLGAVSPFYAQRDGGTSDTQVTMFTKVAAMADVVAFFLLYRPLTAGAHNFKIRWSTNAGTLTSSGVRTMVAVEFKR